MSRFNIFAHRLRRLLHEDRGAVVPFVAVALPALFGAGAIGMDAAHLYSVRGNLQATADASARAGAWHIPNQGQTRQRAISYAQMNMSPEIHGEVLVEEDVTLGVWDHDSRTFTPTGSWGNAVEVVTRRAKANDNPVRLVLASVIGYTTGDVVARAVARRVNTEACVLALAPDGTGLKFDGNVSIDALQCGFAANSTSHDAALFVDGSSGTVDLMSLYLGGGMTDPHDVINTTEPAITHAEKALPDPYEDRDPPLDADWPTQPSNTANENSTPSNPVTLEPGVYPSGFDFKGDVTMAPGVYVMQDDVFMSAQTNVVGDGVTIVLENSDIDVSGGAATDLTAPGTGSTSGVVIMRDGPPSSDSKLEGGSSMALNGAIYMPQSHIRFAGANSATGCLQLVVQSVEFAGDPNFNVDTCSSLGLDVIGIDVVLLVQ